MLTCIVPSFVRDLRARDDKDGSVHKGYRDIGGNRDGGGGGNDWSAADDDDYDDDDDDFDDDDAPRKRRKNDANSVTATATGVIIKMLMLALVSLLVSGGFAVAFSWYFSGKMLFGYKIAGTIEANAIFLVFVASFLLTASTLAITYLRNIRLRARQKAGGPMPMQRAAGGGAGHTEALASPHEAVGARLLGHRDQLHSHAVDGDVLEGGEEVHDETQCREHGQMLQWVGDGCHDEGGDDHPCLRPQNPGSPTSHGQEAPPIHDGTVDEL